MGRPQAAHLGANTLWGEAESSRLSPPPARHPSHEPLYEDGLAHSWDYCFGLVPQW